ncbi:MAG: Lrp/AsnC family transcriptional regulator [Candidatus Bathyarchaeia archaeon]
MRVLTETDTKIIRALSDNGRLKLKAIAYLVGVSDTEVKRRLTYLVSSNIIKFTPLVHIERLALSIAVVSCSCSDLNGLTQYIEVLEACPRVLSLVTCTGAHNLVATVAAEDYNTLCAVIERNFRLNPLFKNIEVSFGNFEKPTHLPLLKISEMLERTPCGNSCLECFFYQKNRCQGCPVTKYCQQPFPHINSEGRNSNLKNSTASSPDPTIAFKREELSPRINSNTTP